VAIKAGDIPEIIKDGVNGYLVDEKSPIQVSDKVSYLIENSAKRDELGKQGLKTLKERFTLDKMVLKIQDIYSKVII
jgi:glycosyltransferase involved in cell wall biosynthesis